VVLTSNLAGHYLGDPSLEPVLAELARRLVPPVFRAPDRLSTHRRPRFRPSQSIVEFRSTRGTITNAIYTVSSNDPVCA